jgi:hypothetical protein
VPNNDDHSHNDVGYAKPPTRTRFQKGFSGNPRGRPKGARNLATVLERTLKERVVINENGMRKTITKLEAAIKQLANKAASGDFQAMRLLATLAGSVEVGAAERRNRPDLSEADEKLVVRMLEKLQIPQKGEDDGNSD